MTGDPDLAPPTRDRGLQAERTTLAWNRTALAVSVNALLALRSGAESGQRWLTGLGVVLLVAAAAVMLYGRHRRKLLLSDAGPRAPAAPVMAATAGIALLTGVTAIASVLAMH